MNITNDTKWYAVLCSYLKYNHKYDFPGTFELY